MATKMVNQLTFSMADIRESFGTCQTGQDLITAYCETWEAACVVAVGGKAQRHAMQLPALCTCLEFGSAGSAHLGKAPRLPTV